MTTRSAWVVLQSTPLYVVSAALPAQSQHGFKEAYLSVLCANPTYYVFVQLEETTALNPVLSTTSSKRCIFILFVM